MSQPVRVTALSDSGSLPAEPGSGQPGATCVATSVLSGGVGELLTADSRLIHQATFCDREGCHTLMVGAFGGSVFLAATGTGRAAGRAG